MPSPLRTSMLTVALLGAGALLFWLLVLSPEAQEERRPKTTQHSEPSTPPPPGEGTARESGERTVPAPVPAEPGQPDEPSSVAQDPSPGEALRAALFAADKAARGPDVLEARRLLEQVLRRHPQLVAELARALGGLRNRELAFQVARLLSRHLSNPEVRRQLLRLARTGSAPGQEVAIAAFWGLEGDVEVAAVLATTFQEESTAGPAQTAAAFGLRDMLPALPPTERAAVQEHARRLLFRPDVAAATRAEAVGLLNIEESPADRAQVRALLQPSADTPATVTLAAARALLTHGEAPDNVLPSLERLAADHSQGPLGTSLKAILDELRSNDTRR